MSNTITFHATLMQTVLIPDNHSVTQPLQARNSYFRRQMQPVLTCLNTQLVCHIDYWLIVGRGMENSEHYLDLSHLDAEKLGVSRRHVRLIRGTTTLSLEDLGTRNGTFINGKKAPMGQPMILSDGDEIRLGKLLLHLSFERSA